MPLGRPQAGRRTNPGGPLAFTDRTPGPHPAPHRGPCATAPDSPGSTPRDAVAQPGSLRLARGRIARTACAWPGTVFGAWSPGRHLEGPLPEVPAPGPRAGEP